MSDSARGDARLRAPAHAADLEAGWVVWRGRASPLVKPGQGEPKEHTLFVVFLLFFLGGGPCFNTSVSKWNICVCVCVALV